MCHSYQPFVLFTLSIILHNLLYLLFIRLIIFSCIVHIVNENIYLSALIFKTGDMYSINLYDNKNESLSKNVGKIVNPIINSKVDPIKAWVEKLGFYFVVLTPNEPDPFDIRCWSDI